MEYEWSLMLLIAIFAFYLSKANASDIETTKRSLRNGRRSIDDNFFGSSMSDAFDDLEREDKFYEQLDKGFDSWEERCQQIGGDEALNAWLKSQENLVNCVLENFDAVTISAEIEKRKKSGELELVFQKYCGDPVRRTRSCVSDFFSVSRRCLRPNESSRRFNTSMKMFDAAVDFACHNNGDRIALFMSEEGMQCVQDHKETIVECINESVPQLFNDDGKTNLDSLIFTYQNCKKSNLIRECVEEELLKCPDPTPSNVVNSLLLYIQRATPCRHFTSQLLSENTSGSRRISSQYLILSFLTSSLFFHLIL